MAKTPDTATMADINDPAKTTPEKREGLPPEQRTVAPTPGSTKNENGGKDESIAETARKVAAEKAEEAREAAAETASDSAERLRDAGESFEKGSMAQAATDRIADNLSEAARSIRETDLAHLTDDLTDFARRQPLLFFGGAALLGFAVGRMLKASERAEHQTHRDWDDRSYARSRNYEHGVS